ncbi:MAG: hypothetical protein RL588_534 [Pseudomonadota bacterium]|jgi:carboxyl-terminal processing protease
MIKLFQSLGRPHIALWVIASALATFFLFWTLENLSPDRPPLWRGLPVSFRDSSNVRVFDRVLEHIESKTPPWLFERPEAANITAWRNAAIAAPNSPSLYSDAIWPMLRAMGPSHFEADLPNSTLKVGEVLTLGPPRRGDVPAVSSFKDFAGLGGTFIVFDGATYVVQDVDPGSPAAGAGVSPGARVFDVHAKSLTPPPSQRVSISLRQEIGSRLQIISYDFSPEIEEKSLYVKDMKDGRSYIRFSEFERDIKHELIQAIRSCPSRGLIFDLRMNIGGRADVLRWVAGAFLGHGQVVAERVGTDGSRVERTRGRQAPCSAPVAVLIGPRTSSAAELLADALRHHGRAVLVGDRTSGRVLESHEITLPDGGRLRIPVADVIAASGARLEGVGVYPDVVAKASPESLAAGEDAVLMAALAELDKAPKSNQGPSN